LIVDIGQIDAPSAMVVEAIRSGGHAVELREVIEERITGHRHEHLVSARRAQQLEQQRVGFAGARGQHDAIRIDGNAASRVIGSHRLSRLCQPKGRRIVDERVSRSERGHQ
jgi:hypothetical protein